MHVQLIVVSHVLQLVRLYICVQGLLPYLKPVHACNAHRLSVTVMQLMAKEH